jgi:hypothetical protein
VSGPARVAAGLGGGTGRTLEHGQFREEVERPSRSAAWPARKLVTRPTLLARARGAAPARASPPGGVRSRDPAAPIWQLNGCSQAGRQTAVFATMTGRVSARARARDRKRRERDRGLRHARARRARPLRAGGGEPQASWPLARAPRAANRAGQSRHVGAQQETCHRDGRRRGRVRSHATRARWHGRRARRDPSDVCVCAFGSATRRPQLPPVAVESGGAWGAPAVADGTTAAPAASATVNGRRGSATRPETEGRPFTLVTPAAVTVPRRSDWGEPAVPAAGARSRGGGDSSDWGPPALSSPVERAGSSREAGWTKPGSRKPEWSAPASVDAGGADGAWSRPGEARRLDVRKGGEAKSPKDSSPAGWRKTLVIADDDPDEGNSSAWARPAFDDRAIFEPGHKWPTTGAPAPPPAATSARHAPGERPGMPAAQASPRRSPPPPPATPDFRCVVQSRGALVQRRASSRSGPPAGWGPWHPPPSSPVPGASPQWQGTWPPVGTAPGVSASASSGVVPLAYASAYRMVDKAGKPRTAAAAAAAPCFGSWPADVARQCRPRRLEGMRLQTWSNRYSARVVCVRASERDSAARVLRTADGGFAQTGGQDRLQEDLPQSHAQGARRVAHQVSEGGTPWAGRREKPCEACPRVRVCV